MGYHLIGRKGTVRDLLDAAFNFRLAIELLAEFAGRYELDLARAFEEMFRCWNTGSPYGVTFDPEYARKGLLRMEIYREIARGPGAAARKSAATARGAGALTPGMRGREEQARQKCRIRAQE